MLAFGLLTAALAEPSDGRWAAAPHSGHAAALMRPAKDVLPERRLGKPIDNVKNKGAEPLA